MWTSDEEEEEPMGPPAPAPAPAPTPVVPTPAPAPTLPTPAPTPAPKVSFPQVSFVEPLEPLTHSELVRRQREHKEKHENRVENESTPTRKVKKLHPTKKSARRNSRESISKEKREKLHAKNRKKAEESDDDAASSSSASLQNVDSSLFDEDEEARKQFVKDINQDISDIDDLIGQFDKDYKDLQDGVENLNVAGDEEF